jgi:hypothetical protein
MIHYKFFPRWNLHHVRAEESCTMLALVEYGMEIAKSAGPEANLDLPGLFDLRAIELNNDTSEDIKKAIRLRKTLRAETGNNPCAYVVGSSGSFGIMRMYGIYAELEGLRKEEMTLVTTDLQEAIDWVVGHLDVSTSEKQAARHALWARSPAAV